MPDAATASATIPPLKDIILERFMRLLDIERRLHVIRAFVDDLNRVSRGEPFTIWNDILWNAVLDVRDKTVIDLYSLTVEMRHGIKPPTWKNSGRSTPKRGLFIEIRDHHLASLTRTYASRSDDDEYEIERHMATKAESFARLFPSCATDSPSAADIEGLCERFRLRMAPLGTDRNKNRAHAHEGDAGTAKMHSVEELEELFAYLGDLLEDLSLVSALASFVRTNMNQADCKETSADMVDLILLGNISDVRRLLAKRTRDELYTRLHEIHDARARTKPDGVPERRFNDRGFVELPDA